MATSSGNTLMVNPSASSAFGGDGDDEHKNRLRREQLERRPSYK